MITKDCKHYTAHYGFVCAECNLLLGNGDDKIYAIRLEWTTTPPTEPGWYQAVTDEGVVIFTEVWEHRGEMAGTDNFSRWLGPVPLAERPTE